MSSLTMPPASCHPERSEASAERSRGICFSRLKESIPPCGIAALGMTLGRGIGGAGKLVGCKKRQGHHTRSRLYYTLNCMRRRKPGRIRKRIAAEYGYTVIYEQLREGGYQVIVPALAAMLLT